MGFGRARSTFVRFPSLSLFAFLLGAIVAVVDGSIFKQVQTNTCQPIDIPLCKDIPYNNTFFPNPIFPNDPQSLHSSTEHFKPLIKTKCNPHIKFFVCSVFAPMCPDLMPQAVTSCRSVCEEVKRDCEEILKEFDVPWPETLNCTKFPEGPQLCMKPPGYKTTAAPEGDNLRLSLPPLVLGPVTLPVCPNDLVTLDPTDPNGTCAFRCDVDTMFTRAKKQLAQSWILAWAAINVVVTGFTVLSFLVDRQRFRFPERSIFYISLCYLCYSLPYLSRLWLSFEQTACDRLPNGRSFLVHSGLDNTICVLSFLFNYYFSMAGSIWWLMLTLTWYLSAARKWVQEEIEKRSSYLHLVAWGTPALMSISVLITQKVDASELTGICSVGNSNPWTLLICVLAPRALFVIVGGYMVASGFSSMCQERECFRRRGTDTSKLEKLMYKIGSFSALYIIPAIVMCFCDLYHMFVLFSWYPATTACKLSGGAHSGNCARPSQPVAEVYMLNLTMSVVVGIATALWIMSPKTVRSWHRFLCCGNCQAPPTQKLQSQGGSQSVYQSAQTRPLIPPNRNPPPMPRPSNAYIPLSVMSNGDASGIGAPANTYSDSWRPSNEL